MNMSNRPRIAQLALCIMFAMTAGNARATGSIDCSATSIATGTNATACGFTDGAYGTHSSAFGYHNAAYAQDSSAFGDHNYAHGLDSSAFGYKNTTTGSHSSAFGFTDQAGGDLATAMGADAIGFVFAPSPRQIAPAVARDIARRLPPEVITVGVFRDESPQRVVEIVNQAGLRGAQLHGHESPGESRFVAERVPFTIKAFGAHDRMLEKVTEYPVDAVLLDSHTPGSGQTFDWSTAARLPLGLRVILAGGLDPDNVAEAVRAVRPWGVDVSSGVEKSPGRKDALKVKAFIRAPPTA